MHTGLVIKFECIAGNFKFGGLVGNHINVDRFNLVVLDMQNVILIHWLHPTFQCVFSVKNWVEPVDKATV